MFWCLEDMYSRNEWVDLVDSKSTKISSTYFLEKRSLIFIGHLFCQFSHWFERKILANIGPRGNPIATTSTWIQNLLLNVKNEYLVANLVNHENHFLDITSTKVSGVWKSFFIQISTDSSNGMLINKASTYKLAIQRSLSWVKISSSKVKESLTVNSFYLISDRRETKKSYQFLYRGTICWKDRSEWWYCIFEGFMHFNWCIKCFEPTGLSLI